MAVQKKFVGNFLSKEKFKHGKLISLGMLCLCIVASFFYWGSLAHIANALPASFDLVVNQKEIYRLLTTTFIHGDLAHLLANSLMLYILMYFVTSFYGPFVSVGLSLVMAMLTNYLVLLEYGGKVHLVGISGVVYYLWGFWMILYLFIQRQYSIMVRILRMGTVFLVLLIPSEFRAQTSYLAHAVGFILGVIAGIIYYFFNKTKLHSAEKWQIKIVSDELSELDEIALNYPEIE